MALRPTQNIKICNLDDLVQPIFEQKEICVDIGAEVVEARMYVLRDPTTLAPTVTRIEDVQGNQMLTGTIVECDCADDTGTDDYDLCADLAAMPTGAAFAMTTTLIGGDCNKYTGAQVADFVGDQLVTDPAFIDAVTQQIDFSTLTAAQVTALMQMLDFSQLTAAQVTQLSQAISFSQLTAAQKTELCATIVSSCDVGVALNLVGNTLQLVDGQGDVIDTADLSTLSTTITNALTFVNGVLTSTVSGIAANVNLRGQQALDAFGAALGYMLPA